jgi:LysR family glycine cleavage system transcriptional activator
VIGSQSRRSSGDFHDYFHAGFHACIHVLPISRSGAPARQSAQTLTLLSVETGRCSMARTPSLEALRIFAVAARHLSFTDAANELCLTQSAVSHRIRGLEEELGFALFQRLTRRLELTPLGRALARKVDQAIGAIDRSIIELAEPDASGPLKVTMLPSVASHWLIPRLPRIRQGNPEIDVQVIADPRLLDLRADGIDLAIRFCRAPNPSYAATRLMGDRVVPVCAPALLERCGLINDVDALLRLPLLHDAATDGDGSDSSWRSWLDHLGRRDLACHAGQYFSEAGMMIEAAALGLGVGLARASLVADRLASGALVCPLELAAPTAFAYYVLGLPEAAERPRIALFRSLLVAEAAATEAAMRSIGLPQPAGDNRIFAVAA